MIVMVQSKRTFFGTSAERTASGVMTYLHGDTFVETDTGNTYKHNGTSWVLTAVDGSLFLPLAGGTMTGDILGSGIRAEILWRDQPFKAGYKAESSHFLENGSANYPAGWTEVDAAPSSLTNFARSFWHIQGTSTDTSWDYRRQITSTVLEDASSDLRFYLGPVLFFDNKMVADVDYYFGLYADNSGIDVDTFTRVHLQWDSAGIQWRVRGQVKDRTSGTLHSGTWEVFSTPLPMPLYFTVIVNASNHNGIVRYATVPKIDQIIVGTTLQSQVPSTSVNYGNAWLRFNQTRGAGVADRMILGGVEVQDG